MSVVSRLDRAPRGREGLRRRRRWGFRPSLLQFEARLLLATDLAISANPTAGLTLTIDGDTLTVAPDAAAPPDAANLNVADITTAIDPNVVKSIVIQTASSANGAGDVTVGVPVHSGAALSFQSVGTVILGADVTAVGGIGTQGVVTLGADVTVSNSGSGDVQFGQTIDSDGQATPRGLTIANSAAGGDVVFSGSVGAANPVGALAVTAAGEVRVGPPIGTGLLTMVATSKGQSYHAPVVLYSPAEFLNLSAGDTAPTGNLSWSGDLQSAANNGAPWSLVIDDAAPGSTVAFGGNLGNGALVDGFAPLQSVNIKAPSDGAITIGTQAGAVRVTTLGGQVYTGQISLLGDVTFENVDFGGGSSPTTDFPAASASGLLRIKGDVVSSGAHHALTIANTSTTDDVVIERNLGVADAKAGTVSLGLLRVTSAKQIDIGTSAVSGYTNTYATHDGQVFSGPVQQVNSAAYLNQADGSGPATGGLSWDSAIAIPATFLGPLNLTATNAGPGAVSFGGNLGVKSLDQGGLPLGVLAVTSGPGGIALGNATGPIQIYSNSGQTFTGAVRLNGDVALANVDLLGDGDQINDSAATGGIAFGDRVLAASDGATLSVSNAAATDVSFASDIGGDDIPSFGRLSVSSVGRITIGNANGVAVIRGGSQTFATGVVLLGDVSDAAAVSDVSFATIDSGAGGPKSLNLGSKTATLGAIGSSAALKTVTLQTTGALNLSDVKADGLSLTAGTLTSNGAIAAGTVAMTASSASTIAGSIAANTLAVTASGSGAITLAGQVAIAQGASFTGNVNLQPAGAATETTGNVDVPSGVLTIAPGDSLGVVTLHAGSTLSGSGGTVAGIQSSGGGTISPGPGAGTLTVAGPLALGGAAVALDVLGTQAGTGYDQIVVTGAGSAATIDGANLALNFGGFAPALGAAFTLIDNRSSQPLGGAIKIGGKSIANATVLPLTTTLGTTYFRVNYDGGDGNDLVLTRVNAPDTGPGPKPEPKPVATTTTLTTTLLAAVPKKHLPKRLHFTITVGAADGSTVTGGTATFTVNGKSVATSALSGAQASYDLAVTKAMKKQIQASYGGTKSFVASQSNTLKIDQKFVKGLGKAVAAKSLPRPSGFGHRGGR